MYAELLIDVELESACLSKVNAVTGRVEVVANNYCIYEVNELRKAVYKQFGEGILLDKVDSFIKTHNLPQLQLR